MQKILLNEIYVHIMNTAIALIVVLFAFVLVNFIFARKIDSSRRKRQFKIRCAYVACFVFVFLL